MKKIIAMALCLMLALSLIGCGTKGEKPLYPDANEKEQEIIIDESKRGALKEYTQNTDGTWECEGINYKYKLGVSGIMPNSDNDILFIYLSNLEEITFEQAWKASGLSSDLNDYFDVKDAVLVAWELEEIK